MKKTEIDDDRRAFNTFFDRFFILVAVTALFGLAYYNGFKKGQEEVGNIIIHVADNAGSEMIGKITDKEIIEGKCTVTAGVYGKFLVTKEQYEELNVGDDIPDYLKGRGN